jgi:hypothetical protein
VGEDPGRDAFIRPLVREHELVGARADRERRHLRVERVVVGVAALQRVVRGVEKPLQIAIFFGDVAVKRGGDVVLDPRHI